MRKRNEGQTLVIGFLLILGLAVGVVVFVQVSVFPDLNEQKELNAQSKGVESMIEFRAALQSSLSSGASQTVLFENEVNYPPQPAAPPNQYAQVSFESGEMRFENAEIKVGETEDSNGNTVDVTERLYIDEKNDREILADITTVYQIIPNYIELTSQNRNIKMDNTVTYEQNPSKNRINHTGQSIVSGRNINLIATETNVDGVKQQDNLDITIDTKSKISGKVRGTSSGSDNIVIETRTTEENSQVWDDLESNNDNVLAADDDGSKLQIILDGTPQNAEYYQFNFMRADLDF